MVNAPVSHYKFYYSSKIGSKFGDEPISLDVLFMPNPYPKLMNSSIKHQWLCVAEKIVRINIPIVEAITGDKLTAFAPTTTGILYENNKPIIILGSRKNEIDSNQKRLQVQ